MKKRIVLFSAMLLCLLNVHATNEIVVDDATIPQGLEGTISVKLNNDKEYTAFSMKLVLPEGVTLVSVAKGSRMAESHSLSCSTTTNMITCLSTSNDSFEGTSGELFTVKVSASAGLTIGDQLNAKLTEINISTTSGDESLDDASFKITIGEPRTLLDETSTTAPEAATDVDVRVLRTIKANEWSTICLPFAMTEAQVKAAFGDDVELADFTGVENDIDDADNIIGITVNFSDVTAIEANHPYIIKVSAPINEFSVDGVNITTDEDKAYIEFDNGKSGSRRVVYSGFYGTYRAGTTLDKFTLFLSDNKFWYSNGNTKMKAFRAYFEFLDILTEVEDAYSSRISMNFSDNESTSITSIDQTTNNRYYDLQGRQVDRPGKGVYVRDGRKVVVK